MTANGKNVLLYNGQTDLLKPAELKRIKPSALTWSFKKGNLKL